MRTQATESAATVAKPSPDRRVALSIEPIGGRIGGIVHGVRLSPDIDDAFAQALNEALARHKMLVFRGQDHLDDAAHEGFAARLGIPVGHPTLDSKLAGSSVLELDAAEGKVATKWHTDVTFMPAYPRASILRMIKVPAAGGDTMWANAAAAYEDLSSELKQLADSLWVVHENHYESEVSLIRGGDHKPPASQFRSTIHQTEHPMVRVVPETGERSLVLGEFAKSLVGYSRADSRDLIGLFQRHIEAPEYIVRWRWSENDVVMWDNRATQHRVVADFGSQSRIVRRVTLIGDVPVSVDGRSSRHLT